MTCTTCGHQSRTQSATCPRCGAALQGSPEAPQAEAVGDRTVFRRQVADTEHSNPVGGWVEPARGVQPASPPEASAWRDWSGGQPPSPALDVRAGGSDPGPAPSWDSRGPQPMPSAYAQPGAPAADVRDQMDLAAYGPPGYHSAAPVPLYPAPVPAPVPAMQSVPGAVPPQFGAAGQSNVVVLANRKSVGVSLLLTFLFGPLGMLYSTVPGGLIMLVVTMAAAVLTGGLSVFLTAPVCMIWGALAVSSANAAVIQQATWR